jgi:GDPmannose 4,6-dehydratase
MRVLITGVAGQDGTLLSELLLNEGWEVLGTRLPSEQLHKTHALDLAHTVEMDIADFDEVNSVVCSIAPDVIFHLAGITSVGFSFEHPELTHKVNVGGIKNLLDAIRSGTTSGAHLINAASTEIFAESLDPITELSPLGPRSPYAESKAASVGLIQNSRKAGIKATNAILANHESYLRTTDFVTGKIANEVARISLGLSDHIQLGNIDVEKNWSSAKDIVAGLSQIAKKKFIGDVILASSNSTKLTEILESAFGYIGISNWQPYVRTDAARARSQEIKVIKIDPSLARKELDWEASTPLNEWVGEMVSYQIQQISNPL